MNSFSVRQIGLAYWFLFLCAIACRGEEPTSVTTCELKKNPPGYNHRLIEVTGFISHGFEDFTVFDPECPSWPSVWLEYGGNVPSNTVYCCGAIADRSNLKPTTIEGILTTLVDDEHFRAFNRLIQHPPDTVVRAKIVGRFFSGRQEQLPNGVMWGGYGHMGCCSLLAIQQVLSVDQQDREDLDYRASADQPQINKMGCSYRDMVPAEPMPAFIRAQGQAELEQDGLAFVNPQSVASNALARFLNISATTVTGIKQMRKSQGRVLYEWKPKGKRTTYMLVASHPYFLSFFAKDPRRIAWVILAAYEISCG